MKRHLVGFLAILTFVLLAVSYGHAAPAAPPAAVAVASAPEASPYRPLYVLAVQTGDPAATAAPATPPALPEDVNSLDEIANAVYRGVTAKDWFLVAGGALAGLGWLLLTLLEKKWWQFGNDRVRWIAMGLLAGAIGLVNAWLAPDYDVDSRTLLGALKVFAAAIATFITAKKLTAPTNKTHVAVASA